MTPPTPRRKGRCIASRSWEDARPCRFAPPAPGTPGVSAVLSGPPTPFASPASAGRPARRRTLPPPRRPPIACGDVGAWRMPNPARAVLGTCSFQGPVRAVCRSTARPSPAGARAWRCGRAPIRFAGDATRRGGADRLGLHARASRHERRAPRVRPGPEETRRGTRAGHDRRSTRGRSSPRAVPRTFARSDLRSRVARRGCAQRRPGSVRCRVARLHSRRA